MNWSATTERAGLKRPTSKRSDRKSMIGFENRNASATIKTVQINQTLDPVLNFPPKFKPLYLVVCHWNLRTLWGQSMNTFFSSVLNCENNIEQVVQFLVMSLAELKENISPGLREHLLKKRMFSFGHCPNYPSPWFGQLVQLFLNAKNVDLSYTRKCWMRGGRHKNWAAAVQSSKYLHLGRKRP